jgi:heat-inducible transcriptional repressor
LLDEPEFYDIDVTKTVFSLLDQTADLLAILDHAADEDPIHVLLGDDFENKHLYPVGIVFSDFTMGPIQGSIGVIGPARLNFSYVIPLVRHLSLTIQEITHDNFR